MVLNEKNWLSTMHILLRHVLLAEKVDDDAFLPLKNSEVFIPLASLSNKYF
jgi:hypothetical protein